MSMISKDEDGTFLRFTRMEISAEGAKLFAGNVFVDTIRINANPLEGTTHVIHLHGQFKVGVELGRGGSEH